jgi:hypothetical protein
MPDGIFDPATAKLGGVLILTVHMVIMSQLKRFFLPFSRSKYFDLMNFPVSFILVLIVLPPWPVWSFEAWSNYVAGSIGLAALASVTAQKVRDTPEGEKPQKATESTESREPPPQDTQPVQPLYGTPDVRGGNDGTN